MVLAGAVMISFSAVFVKWAHVSPTVAGFYRNLFGGLLLILILAIQKGRIWKNAPSFGWALLCGLFFAADLFAWHQSIHFVGPGLATILANFQVFFLAFLGFLFLGERLSARLLVAMPLGISGLFLLAGVRWHQLAQDYQFGIFLGLWAALFYALYLFILKRLQSQRHPLSSVANLAVICFISASCLGGMAGLYGDSYRIPDAQSWAALLAYGFFSQVLGWVLISKGLPKITSSLAGLLLLLQPTLAFIWDILFFGRPVTVLNGLGATVALAAIYLGMTTKRV